MCVAEEYSGIYAHGCAVLTSVSLGEPSFAVAPGYGGWDSTHGFGTRCFLHAVMHSPGLLRNTVVLRRAPAEYMPHTRRIPAEYMSNPAHSGGVRSHYLHTVLRRVCSCAVRNPETQQGCPFGQPCCVVCIGGRVVVSYLALIL